MALDLLGDSHILHFDSLLAVFGLQLNIWPTARRHGEVFIGFLNNLSAVSGFQSHGLEQLWSIILLDGRVHRLTKQRPVTL